MRFHNSQNSFLLLGRLFYFFSTKFPGGWPWLHQATGFSCLVLFEGWPQNNIMVFNPPRKRELQPNIAKFKPTSKRHRILFGDVTITSPFAWSTRWADSTVCLWTSSCVLMPQGNRVKSKMATFFEHWNFQIILHDLGWVATSLAVTQ